MSHLEAFCRQAHLTQEAVSVALRMRALAHHVEGGAGARAATRVEAVARWRAERRGAR